MTGLIHGSVIAWQGAGLLILGPSGAGKSGLALALMAQGAQLVADDQVLLTRKDGALIASAPAALSGLIEARGVGLLRACPCARAPLALATDLGRLETDRLPPFRTWRHLGVEIPLVYRVDAPHFGPALIQYLTSGRQA